MTYDEAFVALREAGLLRPHMTRILVHIAERDPVCRDNLIDELGIERHALTPLLTLLVNAGLAERRRVGYKIYYAVKEKAAP